MDKEYRVIVHGLVQGVCFRALVRERAERYHLCGYVKNLEDGTVEICVQGEEHVISRFLESLQQESGRARIDDLSITFTDAKDCFSSFMVLH